LGRKRVYLNETERIRAFRQRKKDGQIKELITSQAKAPEVLNKKERLLRAFPQYTWEQMKDAYEQYKEVYLQHGYEIDLMGDGFYDKKRPYSKIDEEQNRNGDIILVHGIPFSQMDNNLNNYVFNECEEHSYQLRYSVFLDYCPKCLAKLTKKRSRCS
jgi:hypothetical protein